MLKLKKRTILLAISICVLFYFLVLDRSRLHGDDDGCDGTIIRNASETYRFLRTYHGKTQDGCYADEEKLISRRLHKNGLNIRDVLIAVKTTESHRSRMEYILSTWYEHAKAQVYAVTDDYSYELDASLGGKLISTFCNKDHSRAGLCCKFGAELRLFFSLRQNFKWFCHVDDDNYLNIPNLLEFLSNYDHTQDWYFGRTSWNVPVEVKRPKRKPVRFWFGTLGAGVCLSYSAMHKLRDYASSYQFTKGCNKLQLPDDMYLGYLLENVLKIKLTNISAFNHHLDESQFQNLYNTKNQITLSFGQSYRRYYDPACNCTKYFDVLPEITSLLNNDPFKMKSLHCLLFPQTSYCKTLFLNLLSKLYILNSNLK